VADWQTLPLLAPWHCGGGVAGQSHLAAPAFPWQGLVELQVPELSLTTTQPSVVVVQVT
jgi:hypothetical protein